MEEQAPTGLEAIGLLRRAEDKDRDILHITLGERHAEALARFLAGALPDRQVLLFPPWDCLPYDTASPTPEAMGRRMDVLRQLSASGSGRIVIAPLRAMGQRLPPPEVVRVCALSVNQPLDVESLRDFCLSSGYEIDDRIDEPGEAAFRGATVELFPGGHSLPCRIELTDGIITAIRTYDPATQRSLASLAELAVVPVTELPPSSSDDERPRGAEHRLPEAYEVMTTLAEYLPAAKITAATNIKRSVENAIARINEAHNDGRRLAEDRGPKPLPPEALYLDQQEWADLLGQADILPAEPWEALPQFALDRRPRNRLAQFLAAEATKGRRVIFCAHSEAERGRILRMAVQASGEPPEPVADWASAICAKSSAALLADLDSGFVASDAGLTIISAADLLGTRAEQPGLLTPAAEVEQLEVTGFAIGDLVVHEDHGLARLDGLERLDHSDGAEAARLVFADDERLLVPAAEAGRIWRYGADVGGLKVDRLGSVAWQKRRTGIEKALDTLAHRLAELAARRAGEAAPKLAPPQQAFERFVARFPYPLTPGQRQAALAVSKDMASGHPMNRLVIGDVGFGKTEVALRAAAAAALSGAQVAVCAPTTVLARQHYETFRRRFAGFGINVAHLSRLVTGKEAAFVREGLADGTVQVVVGTHPLASDKVRFANLGLLVIDEEQRFGSAHKTKLRSPGDAVHLLSMTATPIPRTLQTALVGLQDLSVITTPPLRRRPIRTLIADADGATVRQALVRERRRGGQSFVVVPRVADIAETEAMLRELLPRFTVRIAHGAMPAREIDQEMLAFANGDGDILLATSIIESGLDVARANTMIVMRPSLFGLAQLHQLRGRVGRGALQAYCYLMAQEGEELGDDARKRLGTLQAFDRLGAGLEISAADLEHRGAGDLLGDRQAGHVQRVGLGLYQEMLAMALARAKDLPPAPPSADIQGYSGFIPDDYIPEPELRMDLYHRAARTNAANQITALGEEITDRFGPLPDAVEALLDAARIRVLAGALRMTHCSAGPVGIALRFHEDVDVPADFARVIRAVPDLEWDGERLVLHRPCEDPRDQMRIMADLMERLA